MDKLSKISFQQLVKILEGMKSIFSADCVTEAGGCILKYMASVIPLEKSCIWLLNETGRQLEIVASSGFKKELVQEDKFLDLKKSILQKIISSGKPYKIDGIDEKILCWKSYPAFLRKEGIKSFYFLPLGRAPRAIGVVGLFWCKPCKIKKEEEELLSIVGLQARTVLENLRSRRQLELGGNIDGLTGLYTHRYFQEVLVNELSRARRFKYPVCLAMVDVDHFKRYNDTFGHPAGDVALKTIAGIIKRNVRSYDIVARYGGEEITIILPYASREKARPLIERIRKEVALCPFKGAEEVKVTVSIGLASYPDNASTRQEIIQRADQALYLAKEGGRNRVCSSLTSYRNLVRLAFSPPVLDIFYNFVLQGIKDVVANVGNVELFIQAPKQESYDKQLRMMEKINKKKIDAIAVCSKTEGVMEALIRKANEKGILVFVFNLMKIPGVTSYGKVASFIGYDQIKAGEMVGKYLIKLLRGKGDIAIIGGLSGQLDSFERREGFLKALSSSKEMKVVTSRSADWQRNKARIVTRQILDEYPHLDAIFAVSDDMALGAADVIEASQRKGKVFVIGLDGTQSAFEAIKEGKLTATLATNPVEMGRILMRTILRSMIKDEKIKDKIYSPIAMIDQENVNQYLIT